MPTSSGIHTYATYKRTFHRSHIPLPRRLALFYLFNDIVQYAAKIRGYHYLESGASVFLPQVPNVLEKLTQKEKAPYLRTLDIWEERRVYSGSFLSKLRDTWGKNQNQVAERIEDATGIPPTRMEEKKRLVNGEPKLVDVRLVAERLELQIAATQRCIGNIENRDSAPERPLSALITSLSTEAMV